MSKLTSSQVAAKIGVTAYTIKRWYTSIENMTDEQVIDLIENKHMPDLPKYELVGSRGDRVWDSEDIPKLMKFKKWVPHTKNGVFKSKGE